MAVPQDNRAARRYVVGDLALDTGRKSLTRQGVAVVLPPLSFDLLEVLVKAAPDVVSNEAIAAAVWPGLVVSPETVTQRVKLLRQALEDDAREPRYIAGVRGRGYRLIASVTVEGDASGPGARAAPAGKPGLVRWIAMAAAVASVAVLAAVLTTRLFESGRETPGPQSVTVTALPAKAVAVLAFENLTGSPANDLLATVLADGVLHRLAGQRDLLVIARASSFAASLKGQGAREAGERLGARYLVSGSLQQSGDRVRMAAQLLDAQTNQTVRTFVVDRQREDLFTFADDVASRVAEALQVNLGGAPVQYARFGMDAYLAYLRGRSLLATRQVGKVARAGEEFREAVRLAPDFASAWVSLAESMYLDAFINRRYRDRQDALWREVAPILEKAIALEPDNGEAYYLRGRMRVSMTGGDVEAGEADFRRGIELSPNYAPGLEDYAEWLLWYEREAEGLAIIDRARSVDPLDPRNHYMKGMFLWEYRGLEDEAVALLLQALRVDPSSIRPICASRRSGGSRGGLRKRWHRRNTRWPSNPRRSGFATDWPGSTSISGILPRRVMSYGASRHLCYLPQRSPAIAMERWRRRPRCMRPRCARTRSTNTAMAPGWRMARWSSTRKRAAVRPPRCRR